MGHQDVSGLENRPRLVAPATAAGAEIAKDVNLLINNAGTAAFSGVLSAESTAAARRDARRLPHTGARVHTHRSGGRRRAIETDGV